MEVLTKMRQAISGGTPANNDQNQNIVHLFPIKGTAGRMFYVVIFVT
jgi:hypothetical protein